MNIVYCLSRQPEWIKMAETLRLRMGWKVCYWVTRPENHERIASCFPEAIMHKRLDLNRGIPAAGLETYMHSAISKNDMLKAQPFCSIAMDILDRVDLGRSFCHQERQRMIHKLLIYWFNVIDTREIDTAVFSAPPHAIGEYLLYAAMCLRGRQSRIFESTSLNHLHFVEDNVDQPPSQLISAYRKRLTSGNVTPSRTLQELIEKIRVAPNEYKPWYVSDVTKREERYDVICEKIKAALDSGMVHDQPLIPGKPLVDINGAEVVSIARRETDSEPLPRAFKLPGRPISAPFLTRWEHRAYRQWAMLKKLQLQRRYEDLCSPIDINANFIYFAMHYQPERTTCPEGGIFGNQFLAISILASTLPKGWSLYVKEHPSQFRYNAMGELSRWQEYYDDVVAFQNVRLIATDVPSMMLIDNAKAVSTITGAVGWEGLVRGKPVLCFGNPWYGGCKGIYRIAALEEATAAFEEIQAGAVPTASDVAAYAAAVEDVGKPIMTTPTVAKAFDLDVDLAGSFVELLEQFENHTKLWA